MEWLKKLLEAAKIENGKLDVDALITAVNAEFPKHAVPKDTYNTLSEAKKTLEKDIKERDTQLDALKKINAEELQGEIERLQRENKEAKDRYDSDLKEQTLTAAIRLAVTGKVHDESIVSSLVDRGKLVLDGDKVVGLEEQIKGLQASKAFLFKSGEGEGGSGGGKSGFKIGADGKPSAGSEGKPVSLREAIAATLNLQNN